MTGEKTVTQKFFENVPKLSIITALVYIIVMFFTKVFGLPISSVIPYAAQLMLFGAYLAIPAILIDVTFTRSFEVNEALAVGFVNFIALMIEFTSSNWEVAKVAAMYAMYVYLGLIVLGVIAYIAAIYTGKRTRVRR